MVRQLRPLATYLALSLVLLPGCAASRTRTRAADFVEHLRLNTQAWMAARTRLQTMCAPALMAENHCGQRLVKGSNASRTDDWRWQLLPPYQTIVAAHEEALRAQQAPYPFEEYMLGTSRYLAAHADAGTITPEQQRDAFNEAWGFMIGQVRQQAQLLAADIQAAEAADARAWETFNAIASGLATVLTGALAASAAATPPPAIQPAAPAQLPRPVYCSAIPLRNVYGQTARVGVTCR